MARPDSKVEISFSREARQLMERLTRGVESLRAELRGDTINVMTFGSPDPVNSFKAPLVATENAETFRSLPVEIEAIQFTGSNVEAVRIFTERELIYGRIQDVFKDFFSADESPGEEFTHMVWNKLHERYIPVKAGQWIVKDTEGAFYPCDDAVFQTKYEDA